MRHIAPAGTPISSTDLWRWIQGLSRASEQLEDLRTTLMRDFQLSACEFVSSGRAGMTLLLETLYRLRDEPERNQVVIPGYTCYSVPASVERAGLQVRVCDIDPATLSYDLIRLKEFDFSKVLAVVTTNLYGIPDDLPAIERLAQQRGVFMVDDAAQGLGAVCADRPVGTFGDAGLFSLDKGKNITSMQGGILVTRSSTIASHLNCNVTALPHPASRDTALQVLKMMAYSALLSPNRYGITRRLPFLGLGRTPYVTHSPLTRYSPFLGVMASILYRRLKALTEERRSNALRILDALKTMPELTPIKASPEAYAVYVRLPILARDKHSRDILIKALNANGIGATTSYPSAVVDIPELQPRLLEEDLDAPGSCQVAERILTLPTHPLVGFPDIAHMTDVMRSAEATIPLEAITDS